VGAGGKLSLNKDPVGAGGKLSLNKNQAEAGGKLSLNKDLVERGACFLIGLFLDPDCGGNMYLRNITLSQNYRTQKSVLFIEFCVSFFRVPM
jgi:hypothetical protein